MSDRLEEPPLFVSSPRYDVEIVRNALIPLPGHQGELAADVYLPVTDEPVPAVIALTPYSKDWLAGIESRSSHHYFAECGYAVVLVDFRGTGGSTGVMRPPFDPDEASDGVAAVRWAAAQEWCTGDVGMWGASYGAITSMRTAARRPAALKAIIPVVGNLDPERDFVHPSGRRGAIAPLMWCLHNLFTQLLPPLHFDSGMRWADVWRERLLTAEPYFVDVVERLPGDRVWRERVVDAEQIDVPTLCVTGWRDLFVDGMIRAFETIEAPKRLIVGPWMHAMPHESPSEAIDFLPLAVSWWDRWLRGVDNGAEREPFVVAFMQRRGEWQAFGEWPPQTARREFFASASGHLVDAPASPGAVERAGDATIGSASLLSYYQLPGIGLDQDSADDDRRALCFTSAPLDEPLSIFGRAVLRLRLRASADDTQVVAKLFEVGADGCSTFITAAVAGLAQREGTVESAFAPTAYELPPGSCLRLTIASADFPRLWPERQRVALTAIVGAEPVLALPVGAAGKAVAPRPVHARGATDSLVIGAAAPTFAVDRAEQTLTVRLGSGARAAFLDGDGEIDFTTEITAAVSADAPGGAVVYGYATGQLITPVGAFDIRAEISVDSDGGEATGRIVRDGQVTFERRWSA